MKRIGVVLLALSLVIGGVVVLVPALRARSRHPKIDRGPYSAPPVTFDGNSEGLKRSVIVPTLDSPLREGKNAIWCGSFQLAWNRLRDDVVGGPILLANAQAVADQLNRAALADSDLPEDSFYAAGGYVRDGILEEIRAQMRDRFQKEPGLDPRDAANVIVAYAYMQARVPFAVPYFENRKEFLFTEGSRNQAPVSSFGIREEDEYAHRYLREQVEVLYVSLDKSRFEAREFAVDPCRNSKPNQIVLAQVPRQETLLATLEYVQRKIAEEPPRPGFRELEVNAVFLVPNVNISVTHHFREIEGTDKELLNPGFRGLWVAVAQQGIEFRLDRSGVELESEAKAVVAPTPIHYRLNRSFLIYLQKRGSRRPFFVMWVDNAELLCKP